jgi:hypothetical protein
MEEDIHFIIDLHRQNKLAQIIIFLTFSQEVLGLSLDQTSVSLTVILVFFLRTSSDIQKGYF